MKKLLCLIILLFSFIRSEAQSDHICPHEKLYVHTDRANYERGDTVRFRAYLMDTRREATAYSRYVYAELLADSQVISREMVKDDHGVFSGYLSLAIHFVPAIIRFVSIPVIFLLCPLPVTSIVRSLSAGVPFRITARRA